jgi:chromosome segregation ATPase
VQAAAAEKQVAMLTAAHAEARREANQQLEQAEAKLADRESAIKQLRDREEAAQRKADAESRQRAAMAEKIAAVQEEAQQAMGEAEHQSRLREQASAEAARLNEALSTRAAEVQSLESRRQLEVQRQADQTATAQAAAQSAAARSEWLQEQVGALTSQQQALTAKLESATKAHREAQSQVCECLRTHARTCLHLHTRARTCILYRALSV